MLNFISKIPIEKGWSGDKKYCVTTESGQKYLLRISSPERAQNREQLFAMHKTVQELDLPISTSLEYGLCEEGAYLLQTWVDGRDAEDVIPSLPRETQYAYGLEAGRILKTLHSIPAPEGLPKWEDYFNAKIDRKIRTYEACPLKYDGAEHFLRYLAENRHLLVGRPQSFQHGDYHIGNMMVDSTGQLQIIDFDKYDFGDPWEEFNRIVWCAQAAPVFASGLVDGYFDGPVPEAFWGLLCLYVSSNTLSSVPWAIPFGQEEIEVMLNQVKDVLGWYENMSRIIPNWYQKP